MSGKCPSCRIARGSINYLKRNCITLVKMHVHGRQRGYRSPDKKSTFGEEITWNPCGTDIPPNGSRSGLPNWIAVDADEYICAFVVKDVQIRGQPGALLCHVENDVNSDRISNIKRL